MERAGRLGSTFFVRLVALLFGAMLLYLGFYSLIETTSMVEIETSVYSWDNPLWHALFLAAVLAVLVPCRRRLAGVNPKKIKLVLYIGMLVLGGVGLALCQVEPWADAKSIFDVAEDVVLDGNGFRPRWYLLTHPHQLGLYFPYLLFTLIAGENAYLFPQAFNLVALVFIFEAAHRLTLALLSDDAAAGNLVLVMMPCFMPIWLYSVFAYGNLFGLCFSLWALCWLVRYLRGGGRRCGVLSAVFIAIAVLFKTNSIIFLIAMLIILGLRALKTRGWRPLAAAGLAAALTFGGTFGVRAVYGALIGQPPPPGLPMISYVAAGLSTAWDYAPGWWSMDFYMRYVEEYHLNGYQAAPIEAQARADIAAFVSQAKADPEFTQSYFRRKITSMWNNPTFQGFWLTDKSVSAIAEYRVINSFFRGTLSKALTACLNLFQSLVLTGAFAWLWLNRRRLTLFMLLPATAFVGGFIFHLFWEAKGQFSMGYFFLLIPYAACGLVALAGRAGAWLKTKIKTREHAKG